MKRKIRKVIIVVLLLACWGLSGMAQSGASCDSAKTFIGNISLPTEECLINKTVWYKFSANSNILSAIFLERKINSNNMLSKISLWSGTCGGLNLLAQDSITNSNDSLLSITTNTLVIGDEYYLELNKTTYNEDTLRVLKILDFKSINAACSPGCSATITNNCNLVCNGDFEYSSGIPVTSVNGQINLACPWKTVTTFGTPDYFNGEATGDWDVPNNIAGIQTSSNSTGTGQSGNAYGGFAVVVSGVYPSLEELMYQQLRCSLISGATYRLSFYVSLSECSKFSFKNIGAVVCPAFSPPLNSLLVSEFGFSNNSHIILNSTGSPIIATNQWVQITGTFVANGTEEYIVIGGFGDGTATTFTANPNCANSLQEAYYYVDQVTLEAEAPLTISANPASVCQGSNALITLSNNLNIPLSWTPTNLSCNNCSNPTTTINTTTNFTGTFTYCNGCTYSASTTFSVVPPPSIEIIGVPYSCANTLFTAQQTGSVQAGVTYSWTAYMPNGTTVLQTGVGATANYQFNTTTGGVISFTAVNTTGCSSTKKLTIMGCCTDGANPNFVNPSVTNSSFQALGSLNGGVLEITNRTFTLNGLLTVDQNLTLYSCTIEMGYNAKIVVNPGIILTITNISELTGSKLFACSDMWDGIYVGYNNSRVNIYGSSIEDAKNAVVSTSSGQFDINGATFNKNYRSIWVKNPTSTSFTSNVFNTTFKCRDDGTTASHPSNNLLHPSSYGLNIRSHAGADLNGTDLMATTITIGDATKGANRFDNLDFGILSYNINLNAYHNNFLNITPTPIASNDDCIVGTGICAAGNNSSSIVRTANVGNNTSANWKNTFFNCGVGVCLNINISANVISNMFTNTLPNSNTGIRVKKNIGKTITISTNTITSTRLGMDFYNNLNSVVFIISNRINANGLFNSEGIKVNESVPGCVYMIYNNPQIAHVKNGINTNGLRGYIGNNSVSLMHIDGWVLQYGIGLKNASNSQIVNNYVTGEGVSDVPGWENGIYLDYCTSNRVSCNTSYNVSTGLWFGFKQTPNTVVRLNTMNKNWRGLVLNYLGE